MAGWDARGMAYAVGELHTHAAAAAEATGTAGTHGSKLQPQPTYKINEMYVLLARASTSTTAK